MKNSGIEWIGQIPDSWQYFRLKDYYVFEKGKNAALYTQEYIGTHNGEFPVYSGQTENDGIMGTISSFDYDEKECLFTTTVGAKVMTPKVLSGKFSLSQNCLIMKQVKPCCNKYIFYQLLPLFDYTKSMIPSYMQPSLRVADLNTYGFFVPNKAIQEQIADCLDCKCAKIDKLIEVQQAQIEKLKEYKQSVITEAVTKGLYPTAPMKDSGVEWIGKIPEDWEIQRAKYVSTSLVKGNGITKEDIVIGGDTPCVRYGEIYTKYNISFNVCQTRTNKEKLATLQFFHHGDILFACTGELVEEIGKNVVYLGDQDCLAGGDIIVMSHDQCPSFLNYSLYANCSQVQKSRGKAKLKVVHISASEIGNILVALPNKELQQQIADYLDDKCAKIDKLIALKQSKIEKLQEYKKSLIYEYVTGKKEVIGY